MAAPGSGSAAPRLQVRGAIQEGALYIERTADNQLRQALLAGEYCHVLAPRQIGKSSLRLHTARALVNAGIRCVHIDLCGIGGHDDHAPISGWYFSLISTVAEQLGLEDPSAFWQSRSEALPVFHFQRYLRDQVLANISSPIVVFVDEIDYLRSLPFNTDEFIDSLRSIYETRGTDSAYGRLTFCLLGVTAPADMIRNPQITPFNIGSSVSLEDFRRDEFNGFGLILQSLGQDVAVWLNEVYRWTAGHPYMTQLLCNELCSSRALNANSSSITLEVEKGVNALFLRHGRNGDPNLSYAESRLDSKENQSRKAELLALYRRLLEGSQIPVDGGNRLQQELQLCGMVAPHEHFGIRCLQIRNEIFARVFDLAWVREKEGERRLTQAVRRWRESGQRAEALLRGGALDEAEAWAREHPDEVTHDENHFLRTSLASAHKKTQRTITWILGIGMGILAVFTSGLYWQFLKAKDAGLLANRNAESAALERSKAELSAKAERRERERAEKLARDLEAALTATKALAKAEQEQRQRAEAALNKTGKELAAASLAMQHERRIQVLLNGMQAMQMETDYRISPLWDPLNRMAEEMSLSVTYKSHTDRLWGVAFSPDDRLVVTTGDDKTARVWDSRTASEVSTLVGHQGAVRSAAFAPDGSMIVTASDDRTVRIWNAATGQEIRTINAHADKVLSAALSADGRFIASSSADKTACIWELATGRLLHRFIGHNDWIRSVVFSPDGERIVTASDDRTARIWDSHTGQVKATLTGHLAKVRSAAISPDGRLVVTAGDDRSARLWDIATGNQLFSLLGHSDWVRTASFSPDGRQIITAGDDTTVRIWDRDSGRVVTSLQGHSDWIRAAVFSHDGRRVATSSADKTARVWDLQSGRFLVSLKGHTARVWSASFSADGKAIVTASDDRTARLWDAETGQPGVMFSGHTDYVRFASMSASGQYVATASTDGNAKVWESKDGKQLASTQAGKKGVLSVAFSPDGSRLATGGADGTASVWDWKNDRHITLGKHAGQVRSVAYSPDGRIIVTTSDDKTARLWNADTGKLIFSLRGHGSSVWHASFSNDGSRLVTSSSDKMVLLWDVPSGASKGKLTGHVERVWSAFFSKDDRYIVSASDDGTARIWDSSTLEQLLTLRGHIGGILFASFSPDGQKVVTAGDDKAVLVHTINPRKIFTFACRILRTVAGHPDAPLADVQKVLVHCPTL